VLLVALLAVPRPSEGGLIEFIWELSGPQMLGLGAGCAFDLAEEEFDWRFCRATLPLRTLRTTGDKTRPLLFLGGEYAFSTWKNAGDVDYALFKIHRLAFTPELSYELVRGTPTCPGIYAGAGITWERFFGADFKPFDKFGLTLTPLELILRQKYSVAIKIRVYPNGFTPDEFGFGPRLDYDRPTEVAFGAAFSWVKFKLK
jgi:hypothetical protein